MIYCGKFTYKYLLTGISLVILLVILQQSTNAAEKNHKFCISLTQKDTSAPTSPNKASRGTIIRDSTLKKDTINKPGKDSTVKVIDTFNVKLSKDSLEGPVEYSATDSMVLDIPGKKLYLYNEANIKYKDIDLKAGKAELDQQSQVLTATYLSDTSGKKIGRPVFVQGENNLTSDTIIYNSKTQKGLTIGSNSVQGELYVHSEKSKKVSKDVFYAQNNVFTTCNYDEPHFAFRAKKVKFISKKLAVSGFTRPEFEGVPLPIGLPWGIYPLTQGRHSGLLPPQFSVNQQFGLGLEGLGYYKVLNDNFDVTVRGDIYSYGGWRLYLTPSYRKRYRYNGGINFNIVHTKVAFKGDPDYQNQKNFSFSWFHNVDSKARPGTTFSANVNFATSKYNQYIASNPFQAFNNSLNSSISYSKRWEGKPFFLTVTANHSQNTNTKLVSVSLPDIGFSMSTIYPFQPKEYAGAKKWYYNFGIGYNGSFRSQVNFYDTAFNLRQLIDTFQWGASHQFPIQLQLPSLGPFQVAPQISFEQKWYAQQFIRQWNAATNHVDTIIHKGFYTGEQMSFGIGVSTALFGKKQFGKNSRIQAIRHVIRPSFGLSYKPDLSKNDWYETQVTKTGEKFRFSKYDGSIFGAYSEGKFGGINFTLDNNLEMKVRNRKDTGENAIKKVSLIDGFGFSTGYNLMADSFQLSTFNLYARSNLFQKINITAGATIDPYEQDTTGRRINKYVWKDKLSIGRFVGGNIAVSTSIRSKPKDANKEKQNQDANKKFNESRGAQSLDEQYRELEMVRNNPAQFADFNIPWNLNLSYALSLYRTFKQDYSGYKTTLTQSVTFNGDFNLTPKWKMGINGVYDISGSKLQFLTGFVSRDLHCWQMSINITPIGYTRSFNITINPKSGILRDLRINRSRYFYDFR
ncbi:MAG: LPS-assembly protein LptD [Sphingobacteriales bacterium]|nr:MAG: LPS-assembly protein LptD [Sphingobacteriales bacterium]